MRLRSWKSFYVIRNHSIIGVNVSQLLFMKKSPFRQKILLLSNKNTMRCIITKLTIILKCFIFYVDLEKKYRKHEVCWWFSEILNPEGSCMLKKMDELKSHLKSHFVLIFILINLINKVWILKYHISSCLWTHLLVTQAILAQ